MIDGNPKYTGIAMGEFTCNLVHHTVKLTAKAAFVDPRTGASHGWTSCESWSPETMEKMREFVNAMEADLARQHFQGFVPTAAALDTAKPPGIAQGGLGEYVAGDGEQV